MVLTHVGDDVLDFIALSLSTSVLSDTGLEEFESLLILAETDQLRTDLVNYNLLDTEQFHTTTLVWGESSDFADDFTDDAGLLRQTTLEGSSLRLLLDLGDAMSLLKTDGFCFNSGHVTEKRNLIYQKSRFPVYNTWNIE